MAMNDSRIRALVADDDPMIVALLTAFLQARGYEVEQAGDGDKALQRLRAGTFNLVLTDRNMPGLDGLALARAIRTLPAPSYVYCIMLTASSEEASLVASMEAGVDDFVAKPVRLAELGARLRAAERVLALEAGLAHQNQRLRQAYDQLSRELEFARALQLGQLPAAAAFGPLRFDWIFEASSYVGGDFFDYFPLDARHLCCYLADVSGHGVAAAMVALSAQHQLRACSQSALAADPGGPLQPKAIAAVEEFNRWMGQLQDTSLYITLAYVLVDLQAGEAALVQAGHPPPLFSPAPGQPFAPLGDGGLPLGVLPDAQWEALGWSLRPGARLVLYSDGITDCRNTGDEPFGQPRLQALLEGKGGGSLARMRASVRRAMRQWRAGPSFEDDVSFVAMEVH